MAGAKWQKKIIAKAKENDVPFYKDNKLAETLSKLEIGDAIPPELYEVVAEILVFVDDMDKMKAKLQRGRYVIINEVKLQTDEWHNQIVSLQEVNRMRDSRHKKEGSLL